MRQRWTEGYNQTLSNGELVLLSQDQSQAASVVILVKGKQKRSGLFCIPLNQSQFIMGAF